MMPIVNTIGMMWHTVISGLTSIVASCTMVLPLEVEMKTQCCICFDRDIAEEARTVAAYRGISLSSFVQRAVDDCLRKASRNPAARARRRAEAGKMVGAPGKVERPDLPVLT